MKIRNLLNASILWIFFVVLMLGSVGVSGQLDTACYKMMKSFSGFGTKLYPPEMKNSLCDLVDIVDEIDNDDTLFQILSYDLSFIDMAKRNEDVQKELQSIETELEQHTQYIAVVKQFVDKKAMGFKVYLKLPNVQVFNDLKEYEKEGIRAGVEFEMNNTIDGIVTVNVAEYNGLVKFNEYMKEIQDSTFIIDYEALYLAVMKNSMMVLNVESVEYYSEVEGVEDWDEDGIINSDDNCPLSYNPDQNDIDNDGKGDSCDDDVFEGVVTGRGRIETRDCDYYNVVSWSNIKSVNIKEFGNESISIDRMIDYIRLSVKPMCESGHKIKVIILDKRCSVKKYNEAVEYVKSFDFGMVISIFQFKTKRSFLKDKVGVFTFNSNKLQTEPFPGNEAKGKLIFKGLLDDSEMVINEVPYIGGFTEYIPLTRFGQKDAMYKGFGYTLAVNSSLVVGAGFNSSGGLQRIVFNNGDYAWYPYDYYFAEIIPAVGYNPLEGSISGEVVIVANYGHISKYYKPHPKDLEGKYDVLFGLDAGTKGLKFGLTHQINIPHASGSELKDKQKWISASIGASIGISDPSFLFAVTAKSSKVLKYTKGEADAPAVANMGLITNAKETKDRNPFDILIAWVKFVDFITPIGIASNVGNVVTELIIKALKKKDE